MGFLVELREESMTAKRDLKKRVRARQAKTGESYTAARRHVVAAKTEPEAAPKAKHGSSPISVDALVDLTEAATTVGLRCKVLMSEALADAITPARVLIALRELLLAMLRDPKSEFLRGVVLHGDVSAGPTTRALDPRQRVFVERVRGGFTGVSPDGRSLGLHVDGVGIICAVWRRTPTLVVCGLEDTLLRALSGLGPSLASEPLSAPPSARSRHALILEFAGKQYPMIKPQFVIGRAPTCDLVIRDGAISRRHVAIMRTSAGWFVKDLDSTSGVYFKGMQIDNKRIDEGDVFHIGPYELRFTYRGS
jgi:hypothetical protein